METFLTLGEFSITLAGFTSVAIVFIHKGQTWGNIDRFRIYNGLIFSFGSAFASFVPPLLEKMNLTEGQIWFWSSILLLLFILFAQINILRRKNALDRQDLKLIPRLLAPTMGIFMLTIMVAQIVNIFLYRSAAAYMFGILMMLLFAVFPFVHIMFIRPDSDIYP